MLVRSCQLEAEIQKLKYQIGQLPEGKLICARNGKHVKWYNSDGKSKIYIPKKNRRFAEELAVKKYLMATCEDLQKEKKAVDAYLKQIEYQTKKSEQLLRLDSPYEELLSSHFKSKTTRIEEWIRAPFEQNKSYPERCIHSSISGNMVRSKSESMIDACLYQNKIPFRYEAALVLGDTVLYPDFTILHPITEKICYWEHMGLLDKESYLKQACSKIRLYGTNGIYLGINLIITTETKEQPLTMTKIERTIEEFFK